ncbi:MAG: 7-cyano-7-deazaguanine synthase [Pedobacter sp.]|nr:7-cyano-7-deazaguanine synthase [Pedobacter sp.]
MTEIKTKMNQDLLHGLAREETNKAVLLYSGGVDSTAAGMMLCDAGYEVHPLLIDYGQSSVTVERFLGTTVTKGIGFEPTRVIKTDLMKDLTKSKLLGESALDDEDAWVPGRNTLFMVIAGIYAQQINADGISIGYMLDDNFVFGDNDFFHHKGIETVLSKSFSRPMEVFMPTRSKNKIDLLRFLRSRGVLESTVSCWNASLESEQIVTCDACANCIERSRSTAELDKK